MSMSNIFLLFFSKMGMKCHLLITGKAAILIVGLILNDKENKIVAKLLLTPSFMPAD